MAANGELTTWCTCPYDHGDYCKHLAAVLYTIEDAYPDEPGAKPRKKGVNWDDLMTALMTLPNADQLMSMQRREKLERRFPERMCDLYERLFWDKLSGPEPTTTTKASLRSFGEYANWARPSAPKAWPLIYGNAMPTGRS